MRGGPWGWGILVGTLAVGCALVSAWVADVRELNLRGLGSTLNDQIGYVAAARHLALTAELHGDLIYPALLPQHAAKDYLYMPGHYAALAASYRLFGFGAFQSVLPNMLAYVLATIALYVGVQKRYGPRIGAISATLFAFSPAVVTYSVTAMAELTLIAAAVIAFSIFLYVPVRWRPWLGPFLIILPLIFRETGVVLAIPFVVLILLGERKLEWRRAAIFSALSILVIAGILRSDLAAGRPTFARINLFTEEEQYIYNNAFGLESETLNARDVVGAIGEKLFYNTRLMRDLFAAAARDMAGYPESTPMPVALLEATSLAIVLIGGVGAAIAAIRKPRDPLMMGIAVSVGVLVMAILSMYFVRYFQAVRILLLAVPFECIAWAVLLDSINRWLRGVVLSMMLVCGPGLTYAALRADSADLQIARRDVDFLESIPHDDQTVLVAPRELGLEYLYTHYPVKWSFVPANRATLGLLDQVYPVGTLVLPQDASGDTSLTADDVVSEGFMLVESGQVNGDNYLVFKRTEPAAAFQRLDNPSGP